MSRLEFRAWHKTREKYYEVLHLHINKYEGNWVTVKGFCIIEQKDIHIQIQPKDCIIEQMINREDKQKSRIFQGDILEIPYEYTYNEYASSEDDSGSYRGIVHYQPSKGFILTRCIVKSDYDDDSKWKKRDNLNITSTHSLIIGNIHENPELLEQS